jgi:uncharacterized caspase-like protein
MQYYGKSWGIIIGINKFENPRIPRLKNAVNDAKKFSAVLRDIGFENILELYDSLATKGAIISLLSDDDGLPAKVEENDRLIIFFSGHGTTLQSKKLKSSIGYLIPYDGNINQRNSLIEFEDFVKNCTRFVSAKHILFLMDCCFSGMTALGRTTGTNSLFQKCQLKITLMHV